MTRYFAHEFRSTAQRVLSTTSIPQSITDALTVERAWQPTSALPEHIAVPTADLLAVARRLSECRGAVSILAERAATAATEREELRDQVTRLRQQLDTLRATS